MGGVGPLYVAGSGIVRARPSLPRRACPRSPVFPAQAVSQTPVRLQSHSQYESMHSFSHILL